MNTALPDGVTDKMIDDLCFEDHPEAITAEERLIRKLEDPDFLWESIGPDGMKYPTRYELVNGVIEKEDWRIAYREIAELTESRIRQMAVMYLNGDKQGASDFGEMMLTQMFEYAGIEA